MGRALFLAIIIIYTTFFIKNYHSHKTLLVLHGTLLFLILSLIYNLNTLFVITIYVSLYIIIINKFKIEVNDK